MVNSVLQTNVSSLNKSLKDAITFTDIDYEVIPSNKNRKSVTKNEKAIINAYKIWLLSSKNDYLRNPGFGGFFDNSLNDRFVFDKSSEDSIKSSLIDESNEKWPDITILNVQVTCQTQTRSWLVSITIMDKNTLVIDSDTLVVNA